jgi:hypothetical protein
VSDLHFHARIYRRKRTYRLSPWLFMIAWRIMPAKWLVRIDHSGEIYD